jgi:aminoglycoside phosphotransferase (APT) family kinase protein
MTVQGLALDAANSVREALDTSKLLPYLKEHLGLNGPLELKQFPAGFSNLTYLLRIDNQEFVLRRPPVGAKIKTAHDMGREYRILSRLKTVYPKVPLASLYCEDESVIGAPFYVMERVKGIILRAQPPKDLVLAPALMRAISNAFVDNLVEIHGVAFEAAGLGDLGQPNGYVARQIEGWTKRYYHARTDEVPAFERLADWLRENRPPDSAGSVLIHNDYKFDNIVLSPEDPRQIVATLDWEMATIGDPLMDLGTTLAYWVDADDPEIWQRYGFGVTKLPGSFTRSQLLHEYALRAGCEIQYPVFYYVYGLLKIAVIVQQIYFRYRQGFTKDPRFASLGNLVVACGNLAARAIELKRIDRLG